MKEWPRVQPDIELINKFIHCCVVCEDPERGLVFLSALSDCGVEPNLHTFSLLFKVRIQCTKKNTSLCVCCVCVCVVCVCVCVCVCV